MHFRVHRFKKAGIAFLSTLALTVGSTYAQNSFSEGYPNQNLSAGTDNTDQKNNESSVILFERKVLEYRYENDVFKEYEVVHKKVKIFDSEAQEAYSELYIPLNKVEEVFFIKAKSTSPNGAVTETDISKIKSVEENGDEYKLLAIEGIQLGSVVEYSYGLRKSPSIYRSYYLGGNTRTLESEYWIISPKNLSFEHKVFNTDKFTKQDSTYKLHDKESDLLIYAFKNIPATYFMGSTFPTLPLKYRVESTLRRNRSRNTGINYEYNDIARVTYDAINKEKETGAKDIKKLVSKMGISDKLSEREKIIEVESYIKKNFGKVKGQVKGSNTIKFMMTNKGGDDDAFITLYAGIFDLMGIKYELGYMFDRTVRFIDDEFESWANLGEWVIRFPNSDTYIKPTDPLSAPGYLSNNFRGSNMIRIKTLKVGDVVSAVADMVKIPDGPLNRQQETIKISFDENMTPSSKYEYRISGYTSAYFKWIWELTFEDPSVITKVVKDIVESKYDEMKVENITFKFDEENYGDNDYSVSFFFSTKPEGLMEQAADNYIFYPGKFYQSGFVNTEIPSDYGYPVQAKENTTIEFNMEVPVPKGYKVEIPKESNVSSHVDFGNGRTLALDVTFEVEAESVKVKIKEEQKMGKIEPGDLPKLNEFVASLRKIEKVYFVLTKQ